jgi:plasmid segregation protein ParM
MRPIVRAIDVGYSWTKYVVDGDRHDRIVCRAFPSIAPRASGRELAVDGISQRQTVQVPVDDLVFEIGPDAALVQEMFQTIPLDDGYAETPEYLALIRGALRLMHVVHVDLLAVGLPVALYRQRRSALEQRLRGSHPVGDGCTVRVDSVKAFAQPVGALLSASVGNEALRHLQAARVLIIDAGWRTFDWIVTSGARIHDTRSDSVARSMFDVVDAVGRAASRDLGTQLGTYDYARIDEALRKKEPARICGKPLPLEPYLALGQRIADETVTAMRRFVQDGADIDAIVLAGGGAYFFGDSIARAYPNHSVITLPDAFYANCLGFQLAGLYHVERERRRASPARTKAT